MCAVCFCDVLGRDFADFIEIEEWHTDRGTNLKLWIQKPSHRKMLPYCTGIQWSLFWRAFEVFLFHQRMGVWKKLSDVSMFLRTTKVRMSCCSLICNLIWCALRASCRSVRRIRTAIEIARTYGFDCVPDQSQPSCGQQKHRQLEHDWKTNKCFPVQMFFIQYSSESHVL